jgi:hypothetical protein
MGRAKAHESWNDGYAVIVACGTGKRLGLGGAIDKAHFVAQPSNRRACNKDRSLERISSIVADFLNRRCQKPVS